MKHEYPFRREYIEDAVIAGAIGALLILVPFLLVVCLSGCRSSVPAPPFRAEAPALMDTANIAIAALQPAPVALFSRADFAPTPAGERRYIRALRAATPRKIKGTGITYAPNNSGTVAPVVATAKNAVAAAKDAQVVSAPHADNVAGPGATQTVAEVTAVAWYWWVLVAAVGMYGFRKLTA
jgi:hypothetical protein